MRRLLALLAFVATFAAIPARAQADLAAAVTDTDIAVTSDFRGARIVVFGATSDRAGELIIVLRGPSAPVTILRKKRIAGLWLNVDPVRFSSAPAFFSVASAKPITRIVGPGAVLEHTLDPVALSRFDGATPKDADPASYRRGLVRLRRAAGLYQEDPRGLTMLKGGLFQAQFKLPASAPPGDYRADVYLFRRGRLISQQTAKVAIKRKGFEALLYTFSKRMPFLYGLATVTLALSAGYLAAVVFRRR